MALPTSQHFLYTRRWDCQPHMDPVLLSMTYPMVGFRILWG